MERRNDTEGKFKGFSSLATDEDCTEEGVGKIVYKWKCFGTKGQE